MKSSGDVDFETEGPAGPRQHAHFNRAPVLLALCLAGFGVTLTYTGIGVVVPTIQNDFHASSIAANWVINAFVLAFGAFVMAAGDDIWRRHLHRASSVKGVPSPSPSRCSPVRSGRICHASRAWGRPQVGWRLGDSTRRCG